MIVALVLFLFPLAYSPGPGNLFFAATGARFGARSTLPASAGYHVATWTVAMAIGLGFGLVVERFPLAFDGLRVIGAVYVMWLAWKLLRSGTVDGIETAEPPRAIDGAILLLLNPKAYVIIGLMYSQFLSEGASSFSSILVIATLFTLNNLLAFTIWTLAGDRLVRPFRSGAGARRLNAAFGVLLGLVGFWMLLG